LPTEEAARIALRTQQIVGFESGVADTADPLAGSYFVETLTNEIEAKAYELIERIDALGGSVDAIEQGFIQNEIAKSAYEHQKQVEKGEKIIVGVNKFQVTEPNHLAGFKIDDSIRTTQTDKLNNLKARRNGADTEQCLTEIKAAAKDGRNLMPLVIDAVEKHCTLGEICDSLRSVFGEHK
ncbi:MAG TPA: methylmalonyl-CoA mutase family protein, partial [Segetibacter sp.]